MWMEKFVVVQQKLQLFTLFLSSSIHNVHKQSADVSMRLSTCSYCVLFSSYTRVTQIFSWYIKMVVVYSSMTNVFTSHCIQTMLRHWLADHDLQTPLQLKNRLFYGFMIREICFSSSYSYCTKENVSAPIFISVTFVVPIS